MEEFTIAAKVLGSLALADPCERCTWTKLKFKSLPYQIFPSVFSDFDSYEKDVANIHFRDRGTLPSWYPVMGEPMALPEKATAFSVKHKETNINLHGIPDEVIKMTEDFAIIDYKTSRITKGQDNLRPMYEVQLNAYKYIGERNNEFKFDPVTKLFLLYCEPPQKAPNVSVVTENGFSAAFKVEAKEIPIDQERVVSLLYEARRIYDLRKAPAVNTDCSDCKKMTRLTDLLDPKPVLM